MKKRSKPLPRLRPHVIISEQAIADSKRDERIRRAAERAMDAVDSLGDEFPAPWTIEARKGYDAAIRALKAILREVTP
jgi:hypothetical protein